MTTIKYTPQAYLNFKRKSTEGFSIQYILCDFTGGVSNYAQMTVESIDQRSWVNFYGNMGKILLSLISMFFDLIFMCQHFLLYSNDSAMNPKTVEEEEEPLLKPSEHPQLENV
ncbi:Lysosomal cystine transporter [Trema orientale]|uniref:Lysosomal cystine transporter n=1 Tax=Trema orientale TaxID=63057 RepID=A0A2P5FBS8_TREOI|nr:Lysosomal cystine transporter [Trema orientale]